MRSTILYLLVVFFTSEGHCATREYDSINHVVYLIGNTATREISDSHMSELEACLLNETNPFSVIHLGDILQPGSLDKSSYRLDLFHNLVKGKKNGRLFFTPGDKDWNNSGKDGLEVVRKLEKEIEKLQSESNIFMPSHGCPGPEIVDLSPHLKLIVINTQWWLHPYDIPETPDADCSNLTKEEFIESLEEAIEESAGKNILIVGHHPIISAGIYGGHMTLQKHLFPFADAKQGNRIPLPLLGSFYAAYRQNVGIVRDMANEHYQGFIDQMSDILYLHPGLVYASSHDYSLQLIEKEKGYQVISGSINENEPTGKEQGLLFSSSKSGFTKITYFDSGKIEIGFIELGMNEAVERYSKVLFRSACDKLADTTISMKRYYVPCLAKEEISVFEEPSFPADSVTVTAGHYEVRGIKTKILGSLYRTTWSSPVKIAYLNLDTSRSGLTPFALGGGRQTTTLKFLANDGKEYAFRSVDKNLVNALPRELENTIISRKIKELTATDYPYGAIIASSLMDETDILHARPELYVLPDHPGLGVFQEPYAGLFGMLEERPKDPYDQVNGFMEADDVTRSVGLFRKLYKDNDKYVDAEALGKARVFDILIGDWGRHEDNWKWAGYDRGDKRVYYPIPRDRDHAFSRFDGLLPYLADREWAMPMIESFDYDFHDIKSLTWPGRHVDRLLLTELDRNDWRSIAEEMQQIMTDKVIEKAISTLPPEVIPVSGIEIGEMLKSRRAQLPDAVNDFYFLLARQVDVVGSNKHEYTEVDRLESGNVKVKMYKRNREGKIYFDHPLYKREFKRNETREICIYGLDGDDKFKVNGSARKSIPVRIIGGPGQDEIEDYSSVKGPGKSTIIYDNESTVLHLGSESKNKTSDDPGINRYDRKSFMYNTYLPMPYIYYSSDDGLAASLGINWTTHGFRKEEYKSKHYTYLRAGTSGNVQLGVENHWKELVGEWDAGIDAVYGHYYPYYNFFGLGNNSVKDPDLYDSEYYRINVKGLKSGLYTEKEIFNEGAFRLGLLFEDLNSDNHSDSLLLVQGGSTPGSNPITLGGISTRFYLDFRDREVFASRGLEFLAENKYYLTIDGASGNFGQLQSYLKYYGSFELVLPVTLVFKVGGSKNYGHQPPFYKYSYLGQYNNLRGYKRNRFTGDASAYLNSELRLHLGEVENALIPFETGIFGFYDLGKVWFEGVSDGSWHAGYGAGFYISPLTHDYLFAVQFESSVEETLLVRIGLGFFLDN